MHPFQTLTHALPTLKYFLTGTKTNERLNINDNASNSTQFAKSNNNTALCKFTFL